ncbi:hypothetical protein MIR68_009862 [Amoeboaphelidium protococcarum]|nr:hypothetical protein MIR68_009862 [Amoeboaphelidium protococcarum]
MTVKYSLLNSKKGLKVLHIHTKSPIIHATIVVPTKADNDKGLPHTLEHLIFMGSQHFPFKGTLDQLANLSVSNGTNAWTDVDHTAYTVTTASVDGMLKILPVYIDHILNPTLTDSAYVTEVFHHTSSGEQRGVVVSEMKARQNTMEDLSNLALHRALYGGSSLSYETGGFVKELRQLKAQECRDFHKQHYNTSQILIIVCGGIEQHQLSSHLDDLDSYVNHDTEQNNFQIKSKVWSGYFPQAYCGNKVEYVKFPSDDNSVGSVLIGWRIGHNPCTVANSSLDEKKLMIRDQVAVEILMEYLTDSSLAVLQKVFVEGQNDDKIVYASDVDYSLLHYSDVGVSLEFVGANTDHLSQIEGLLYKVLQSHSIDMDRIKSIVQRRILNLQDTVETDPSSYFVRHIIPLFMYGQSDEDMSFAFVDFYSALLDQSSQYWNDLLTSSITSKDHCVIISEPSLKMGKEIEDEDRQYCQQFCKGKSEEELKRLDQLVVDSAKENDTPIPHEVLQKFGAFTVDKSKLIQVSDPTVTVVNTDGQNGGFVSSPERKKARVSISGSDLKYVSVVDTEFVSVEYIVDVSGWDQSQKLLLEILMDCIFTLPVLKPDGITLSSEDVVQGLTKDTIAYGNSLGFGAGSSFTCGLFASYVVLEVKAHNSKVQDAVKWLGYVINHSQVTEERVKVSIDRLLGEIPDYIRDGSYMLNDLVRRKLFQSDSAQYLSTVSMQKEFLDSCNPDSTLVQTLQAVRADLAQKTHCVIHGVCGQSLTKDLRDHLEQSFALGDQAPVAVNKFPVLARDLMTDTEPLLGQVFLCPIKSIESSYMQFYVKGPTAYNDPMLPSLMTVIEYLTMLEGPFWKSVRGQGLAYHMSMKISIEMGMIYYRVYRSPNGYEAYGAVTKELKDYASQKLKWNEQLLKCAKSSLFYSLVQCEDNVHSAASESFISSVFKGLKKEHRLQWMLDQIEKVTLADISSAFEQYLGQFTDPLQSIGFATTMPAMTDAMQKGWTQDGFKVEMVELISPSDQDDASDSGSEQDED